MAEPQLNQEPDHEEKRPEAVVREADRRDFPERPGPSVTKVNRGINYAFMIVESLILIRLLLKALGGNPVNGFVDFIYTITAPFVTPFLSVFNAPTISTSIGVLEFGSIVAIAFYVLLNYAIVKLIWIATSRN